MNIIRKQYSTQIKLKNKLQELSNQKLTGTRNMVLISMNIMSTHMITKVALTKQEMSCKTLAILSISLRNQYLYG